jgi:hypothetical protein
MANSTETKRPNRQYIRRLDGLTSKLLSYGELKGMELFFLAYNREKDSVYTYSSSMDISRRINELVS